MEALFIPPISWFSAAKNCGELVLEQYSNFRKQTLRNRCYIDSPNGQLALTLPIDRTGFDTMGKCLMKDVRLSNHFDWRRQHWQALETSYHNSPFFDYLQDDFKEIYDREWIYLLDLNEALIKKCLELLELDIKVSRSESFQGMEDVKNNGFIGRKYYQVFNNKHEFLPDLSIVDLLFNMGPEAQLYI